MSHVQSDLFFVSYDRPTNTGIDLKGAVTMVQIMK